MSNVVLCGDSFYHVDPSHPGLHWADRLDGHNVYGLAKGGATNFAIWHQIQHTPYFNPDLVLISFTAIGRLEFSIGDLTPIDLSVGTNLEKQQLYTITIRDNIDYANAGYNSDKYLGWMPYYIEEFEVLKNSIYIRDSLNFLRDNKIPYRFTLGGFHGDIDLSVHEQFNILPNGWHHKDKFLADPWFHIADNQWHADHADFVKNILDFNQKSKYNIV